MEVIEGLSWVRRVALASLLCVSTAFTAGCGSDGTEDVVDRIPVGSKLSELDRFLADSSYDGEVIQWLPRVSGPAKPATDRQALERTGREVTNEYGGFTEKKLGTYSDWKSNSPHFDKFTGEVNFYIGNMASEDIVSLIYVEGVLRKKDWGHLPG